MSLTDEILAGNISQVRDMVEKGADVNALDIYGYTPLIEAAIANQLEIAKLLIKKGALVNKNDLTRGTALHWAVENSNVELTELLLEKGADPNAYTAYSQPPLALPLLRNQQDLKELLYRHRADVNFANDYINAKLLGHRFELVGRVDIVNDKNTFIEVDFEGFILEFTVSVIQDSLVQFKNNFAARNLRSHFGEFDRLIEAFKSATELLSYQQHLIDITLYRHRLEALSQCELLLLPVGYEGHAITFIKYKNFLAKCDRGANSLKNPSVGIYEIGNPRAFNVHFLKQLIFERQNTYSVGQGIMQALNLKLVAELPLASQLSGNCSWANVEAAIPTMLLMLWLFDNAEYPLLHYQKAALSIYKQWIEWDKDWALHQCVESFYSASPARKAAKAALLAAVLFQSCRYTVASDLQRANKILGVLSTPEYDYVLQSYLTVYKDTPAGHNLNELIDLYSK